MICANRNDSKGGHLDRGVDLLPHVHRQLRVVPPRLPDLLPRRKKVVLHHINLRLELRLPPLNLVPKPAPTPSVYRHPLWWFEHTGSTNRRGARNRVSGIADGWLVPTLGNVVLAL